MQAHNIDLGYGITQLDAQYIKSGVAAVYLLQQGDQIAIIETGTAHTIPAIMKVIDDRGLNAQYVAYVIPTHVHLDHAGGAGELISICPNAQLVIHPYGAKHMIDPSRLVEGTIAVYGEEIFHQLYGELKPVPEDRVIEAPDNFELELNGRKLKFLDTPGHARHHFCVYDETSRGIFSGDTFGLSYPQFETDQGRFIFPTTTPVQFDPQILKSSIDRLLSLQPQSIYLTHFGKITPTTEMVAQLIQGIDAFTEIALSEKDSGEQLQTRIADRMMNYLLDQLNKMGCTVPENVCREIMENDVTLNSMGLDVWLKRNN